MNSEPSEKMKAAAETATNLKVGNYLNRLIRHLDRKTVSPFKSDTKEGVDTVLARKFNIKEILKQWNVFYDKKSLHLVVCSNDAGDYADSPKKQSFKVLFVIYRGRCVYQNICHKAFRTDHYETHETIFAESLRSFEESVWIEELISLVEILDEYPSHLREKKEQARIAKIESNLHLKQ
jgi:hypothetical protein